MMKQTALIIEDNKDIARIVKYNLDRADFDCDISDNGSKGLAMLAVKKYDIVILDLMLPGIDGLEVCRRIKGDKKTAGIPIVMVTAKGEETDRIVGFELGADDYVVKPFSARELVLRVKAVLRRKDAPAETAKPSGVFKNKGIMLDTEKRKASVDGKEITLTHTEFNLLAIFLQRPGILQTRESLLNDVWDISAEIDTRTTDVHIKRLREKLGKYGNLIETVRGAGYRLKEDE